MIRNVSIGTSISKVRTVSQSALEVYVVGSSLMQDMRDGDAKLLQILRLIELAKKLLV